MRLITAMPPITPPTIPITAPVPNPAVEFGVVEVVEGAADWIEEVEVWLVGVVAGITAEMLDVVEVVVGGVATT
jgi:hypothetical protein